MGVSGGIAYLVIKLEFVLCCGQVVQRLALDCLVFCQLLKTSHRRYMVMPLAWWLRGLKRPPLPTTQWGGAGRGEFWARYTQSLSSGPWCVLTFNKDIPLRISSRDFRCIKHHAYVNFLFRTCSRHE